MDENAPQAEYVSDDGQWLWNGYQWVPNTSTAGASTGADPSVGASGYVDAEAAQAGGDAAAGVTTAQQGFTPGFGQPGAGADPDWFWDGQQWVPANPAAMPPTTDPDASRKFNPLLIIAGVAALIIVALVSVWLLTRDSGTTDTAPAPIETTETFPPGGDSAVIPPDLNTTPFPSDPNSVVPLPADPLDPGQTTPGQIPVDQAAAAVDWSRFTPGTRERVDAAASTGNCAELANLRTTAIANDATVLAATGLGTADLVAYIQAQENAVGCTALSLP